MSELFDCDMMAESLGDDDTDLRLISRKRRLLKKAPDAPKRFKSAYICFVMEKMDDVKKTLPQEIKVTETMKILANMWRELPQAERQEYEKIAEADKSRYFDEMSKYSGPMQVPNKRQKKPPGAPKRAMSAFLSFSQLMRPHIRAQYPDLKNTDISGVLAQQWRQANEEEKRPHLERELKEREKYHEDMAKWKEEEVEKVQQKDVEDFDSSDFLPPDSHSLSGIPSKYVERISSPTMWAAISSACADMEDPSDIWEIDGDDSQDALFGQSYGLQEIEAVSGMDGPDLFSHSLPPSARSNNNPEIEDSYKRISSRSNSRKLQKNSSAAMAISGQDQSIGKASLAASRATVDGVGRGGDRSASGSSAATVQGSFHTGSTSSDRTTQDSMSTKSSSTKKSNVDTSSSKRQSKAAASNAGQESKTQAAIKKTEVTSGKSSKSKTKVRKQDSKASSTGKRNTSGRAGEQAADGVLHQSSGVRGSNTKHGGATDAAGDRYSGQYEAGYSMLPDGPDGYGGAGMRLKGIGSSSTMRGGVYEGEGMTGLQSTWQQHPQRLGMQEGSYGDQMLASNSSYFRQESIYPPQDSMFGAGDSTNVDINQRYYRQRRAMANEAPFYGNASEGTSGRDDSQRHYHRSLNYSMQQHQHQQAQQLQQQQHEMQQHQLKQQQRHQQDALKFHQMREQQQHQQLKQFHPDFSYDSYEMFDTMPPHMILQQQQQQSQQQQQQQQLRHPKPSNPQQQYPSYNSQQQQLEAMEKPSRFSKSAEADERLHRRAVESWPFSMDMPGDVDDALRLEKSQTIAESADKRSDVKSIAGPGSDAGASMRQMSMSFESDRQETSRSSLHALHSFYGSSESIVPLGTGRMAAAVGLDAKGMSSATGPLGGADQSDLKRSSSGSALASHAAVKADIVSGSRAQVTESASSYRYDQDASQIPPWDRQPSDVYAGPSQPFSGGSQDVTDAISSSAAPDPEFISVGKYQPQQQRFRRPTKDAQDQQASTTSSEAAALGAVKTELNQISNRPSSNYSDYTRQMLQQQYFQQLSWLAPNEKGPSTMFSSMEAAARAGYATAALRLGPPSDNFLLPGVDSEGSLEGQCPAQSQKSEVMNISGISSSMPERIFASMEYDGAATSSGQRLGAGPSTANMLPGLLGVRAGGGAADSLRSSGSQVYGNDRDLDSDLRYSSSTSSLLASKLAGIYGSESETLWDMNARFNMAKMRPSSYVDLAEVRRLSSEQMNGSAVGGSGGGGGGGRSVGGSSHHGFYMGSSSSAFVPPSLGLTRGDRPHHMSSTVVKSEAGGALIPAESVGTDGGRGAVTGTAMDDDRSGGSASGGSGGAGSDDGNECGTSNSGDSTDGEDVVKLLESHQRNRNRLQLPSFLTDCREDEGDNVDEA